MRVSEQQNSGSKDSLALKPLLRGHIHQAAFFVALGACPLLIAKSSSSQAFFASLIYSICLMLMFGVSALYHRPHWQPKARALMKRFDHCAIFFSISGAFTPICLFGLSAEKGHYLLGLVWAAAFLGVFQSVFWLSAPKWVTAIFYVALGWLALPYLSELKESLGIANLLMILAGGVAYTAGAIFYALKWPKLSLNVFGYHELFHSLTIIGALFHFIVIYQLIR